MIEIEDGAGELARTAKGTLSRKSVTLSVADLEYALLAQFPREDAEPWDRMGLLVGDGAAAVANVAVTLDPTLEALGECAQVGANVLVTHHPAFIEPPELFTPQTSRADIAGTCVWKAASEGIALMNFHTALDVSVAGGAVLPRMLSLSAQDVFEPLAANPHKGYGRICRLSAADGPMSVARLAARCLSVFGRVPRVWTVDETAAVSRVVTTTGSASGMVADCIKRNADVLICGEVKYHDALAARQAGVSVIELGHDVSELPLCAPLAAAVEAAGIPEERIHVIDQSYNWSTPEAVRL